MTYKIALLGDILIATASTLELLRNRAEAELEAGDYSAYDWFDSLRIEDGLTLYTYEDDVPDHAEIVYSGTDCGWLQDDEGRMAYAAAARNV